MKNFTINTNNGTISSSTIAIAEADLAKAVARWEAAQHLSLDDRNPSFWEEWQEYEEAKAGLLEAERKLAKAEEAEWESLDLEASLEGFRYRV